VSDWSAALDALEEWVRRAGSDPSRTELTALEPAPGLPVEPLPGHLRLRAQALAEAMTYVEQSLLRRREQLSREQAYGAA
jgi:hypothetical protein